MNKPLLRAVSSNPQPVVEPDASMGVGASLRALREARGHSISDVSARLKYSVRQLQALEGEEWQHLPDGFLLRGLVKNYARFLETDTEALLVMLDNQVGTRPPTIVTAASRRSSGNTDVPLHSEPGPRSWSWGWLLVIVALLVVAGVYAIDRGWIPDSWLIFDWLKALK